MPFRASAARKATSAAKARPAAIAGQGAAARSRPPDARRNRADRRLRRSTSTAAVRPRGPAAPRSPNTSANITAWTDLAAGDPDVDVEDAYFTGEEAPGGDNPTPDQDIVDDIGKALGVEYEDNEELKRADKVVERDKHRWELDPASSEDYKDRK